MSRIAARIWSGGRPLRTLAAPAPAPRLARSLSSATTRRVAVAGPSSRPIPVSPLRSSPISRRGFHASAPSAGIFNFKLADIGEGITEVEIIKWHVKEGDVVEEFDSLCEVQSDKSVVEITSPQAGKVSSLSADPGKVVKVGQTLCEIDVEGAEFESEEAEEAEEAEPETAAPAPAPTPAPAAPAPTPAPAPAAAPAPAHSGAAKPKRAPRPHPLSDTAMRFEGEASILPAAAPQQFNAPESVEARRDGAFQQRTVVKTSPAVRALAGRLGVELTDVPPTGDGGRVTRDDVERFAVTASAPPPAPSAPAPRAAPAAAPVHHAAPVDRGEATERMEMGRTRKVMYKAMGSMGNVPHFGYVHTLNLTNLLPLMKAANAPPTEPKGYIASDVPTSMVHPAPLPDRQKTSVLAFLVKAIALALEEHPIMRSRVKESGDQRWLEVSRDANIGIAVSDPKLGLLTPSLPTVDPSAPVADVASKISALRTTAARPGPLPHITLSSVGGLGEARGAMPVLPPGGGLAIAAVGRAAWEMEWTLRNGAGKGGVWAVDPTEVEKAGPNAVLRCTVGWSGDHRVLEGAELIAFTETWKRYVEEPWRWLQV